VDGSGGLGHLDSIEIPAGAVDAQELMVSITTPAAFHLPGIQPMAANADGAFSKSGPGSIGILGAAKVCLLGPSWAGRGPAARSRSELRPRTHRVCCSS